METLSKYIELAFITLFLFVFLPVGFSQPNLLLSSTDMAPANTVRLQWTWTPSQPSATYGYTLFQWDNGIAGWQSTSTQCDKTIRVLNVYPDIAISNTLKTWMDDPAIGFGLILVTPVSITVFNTNPDACLKDGSGNYKYDVIMFGSCDRNNCKDLNPASTIAVRDFLNSGYGVLFGHDTQTSLSDCGIGGLSNFVSLADKTNLDIDIVNDRMYLWRGSTNIRAINNGYLLNYPHTIPVNVNLTIPSTHTTGQTAKGIVWMNFPNTIGSSFTSPVQTVNGGTNDFYLTTWNNAAMIQTGHSNGQATYDEKRIIANTLWYLAQFTTDTTTDVCSAPDIAPPAPPAATWSNCKQINISTCDSGTVYRFYVKATNMINNDDIIISNELTVENKTGICGYFISEDTNPNGVPLIVYDASNNIITPLSLAAADCEQVIYTMQNPGQYVHIQAVDCAGNLSAVTTLQVDFIDTDTVVIYDVICCNTNYRKHGFNIPSIDLEESGLFSYQRFIADTFGCDSVIILNLTVNPIPDIEIAAISDDFCEQNSIELRAITNGDSFLWNTGSTESSVILSESGVYSVTASLGDCKKTAYYTVEECPCIIFIPNVFTPNEDGFNDVFRPEISCFESLQEYGMYIYNRWGTLIFQSFEYTIGWDGGNNAEGTYFCIIEFTNSMEKQFYENTSVTLLR